ncbi:MAG TPA: tetraacyldisaccharide 4'-kinase [Caulobacteraceae bacterium]
MRLATPRWWYVRDRASMPVTRALLSPISWIWAWATARRLRRGRPFDPGVPVICVGNLTVGGSGKTPVVQALARQLAAQGRAVHIIARGHGGALAGPVRVEPGRHTAADVGDEAVMMARDAPVWVARDRAAAAAAAVAGGARVLVMDDGFQSPAVRKTLSIVVVDGETRDGEWPFGDGRVFPCGPMREPLGVGLARADAVIVLAPADLAKASDDLLALFEGRTVLIAHLVATEPPPPGPQIGFAGIAKPWKMERALKAAGCELIDFAPLPDHATLSEATLHFLAKRARGAGAGLVTSEKDWARLSPSWRERVHPWPVRAVFDDPAALDELLARLAPL